MNSNNSDKIIYSFDTSDIIYIPKDDYEKFEFVAPNVCECAVGVIVGETGAIMTHTFKQDSAKKIGEFIKTHLPDQELTLYTYGGNYNGRIVLRKQDFESKECHDRQEYKKTYYSWDGWFVGYPISRDTPEYKFLEEILNKESPEGFFTLSAEEKSEINVKLNDRNIDLYSNYDVHPSQFPENFMLEHKNFIGERNISVIERGVKKGCNTTPKRGNEHQYTPIQSNLKFVLNENSTLKTKIVSKSSFPSKPSQSELIKKANVSGYTKH